MRFNNYRDTLNLLLLCFFSLLNILVTTAQNEEDIFDLRIVSAVDCENNQLASIIQIRAQSDTFQIGTSSILLNYDADVIEFSDYQALNFYEDNRCLPGVNVDSWDSHDFNGTFPGLFNLTMVLKLEEFSCPIVGTEWIDIGRLDFSVKNINGSPNFSFNLDNTNFNRSQPNNGEQAPQKGNFTISDEVLAVSCACDSPILLPDTIVVDCPNELIEANLLENDITTNSSISIVETPAFGTATINPNGILTYTPTNITCGVDDLIYQVCNDNDDNCCTQEKVIIRYEDLLPPIFSNIPTDISADCASIPSPIAPLVSDNCGQVEVNLEERETQGNCANSFQIIRTWTATDLCGNTTVASQTVTVEDTQAPIINCPTDVTVNCGVSLTPESLQSQPTTSDNCSTVQLDYEDVGTAPNDCSFESVTIQRIWIATDDCGNTDTCSQNIIVVGSPCPPPIIQQFAEVGCDQEVVNLFDLFRISDIPGINIEIGEAGAVNLIETPAEYVLSNDGCNPIIKEIVLTRHDDTQCLIESSILLLTVFPQISATTFFSDTTFCSVGIEVECPDEYSVTWTDDKGNEGEGDHYTGLPGESGVITFHIRALNLPITSGRCVIESFSSDYGCAVECPPAIAEDRILSLCSGDAINIFEEFNISPSSNFQVNGIDYDTSGNLLINTDGCDVEQLGFSIQVFDENICLLRDIGVALFVTPKIEADIIKTQDLPCGVSLLLSECTDKYNVFWSDSEGRSGEGASFTGVPNTAGTVTFSVEYNATGFFEGSTDGCLTQQFTSDYSCIADCPPGLAEDRILTICGEERIDVLEYLGISSNDHYTIQGIELDSAGYITFLADSCGIFQGGFGASVFDENDCLLRSIGVSVFAYPEITGTIVYDSVSCDLSLDLDCDLPVLVSWEDEDGNSGLGSIYEVPNGKSGAVKFFVDYLATTLPIAFEDICVSQVFETDYDCPNTCPAPEKEDYQITLCSEEPFNIFEFFDFTPNVRYTLTGIDVANSGDIIQRNQTCELIQKEFVLHIYDEQGDCIVRDIFVTLDVFPEVLANIVQNTVNTCSLSLSMECPELYLVTWEDSQGRTGEGREYIAEDNTEGVVTFHVEYLSTGIILSDFNLECLTSSFEARYSCKDDCPPSLVETDVLTVCPGEPLNIFDRFGLSPNIRFEILGLDFSNLGNVLMDFDNCQISQTEFSILIFNADDCIIKEIRVELILLPIGRAEILHAEDNPCSVALLLECEDQVNVTWTDSEGRSGTGNLFSGLENTGGTVTFFVEYLNMDSTLQSLPEGCFQRTFTAEYNCLIACEDTQYDTLNFVGCEGDILDLFERLNFSEEVSYVIDDETIEDIRTILLERDGEDPCAVNTFDFTISILGESACLSRVIYTEVTVLPPIVGAVESDGCSVELELACGDLYYVIWVDDDNYEESNVYEAEPGTKGEITFVVSHTGLPPNNDLLSPDCFETLFTGSYECCNPAGTLCDDGNDNTYGDREDGECGCAGFECKLESRGVVVDRSGLAACELAIEMTDGRVLVPAIVPADVNLEVGLEIVFTFIEIEDAVDACQVGQIVEIICLEPLCSEAGTPCNDNDLTTINDAEDGNCNCIGETIPETNSEIDLRFRPELDCETNSLCATLQIKAQEEDFYLGTSLISFAYNTDALEFSSYTSTQFDEEADCIEAVDNPWSAHTYEVDAENGLFDLGLTLNKAGESCPIIQLQEWEDIGIICFDITDNTASPGLEFDKETTFFLNGAINDPSIEIANGQLINFNRPESLFCIPETTVTVAARAFLQGPYNRREGMMRDNLRRRQYIPLIEPYTGIPSFVHVGQGGGESVIPAVLDVTGENAIVDWVFLELRSAVDASSVVATRAALIQRDGDIVDTDGISPVSFKVTDETYYVVVRHRNHLGVMTANPMVFDEDAPLGIDFTDPDMPTYGNHAQLQSGDLMFLWGGNANPDKHIILAGGGLGLPDRDKIFFDIFLSLWLADSDKPISYNSVLHGYYNSDTNMDGRVKYQGPRNDIDAIIFFNVLFHPENENFRLNFAIPEQLP